MVRPHLLMEIRKKRISGKRQHPRKHHPRTSRIFDKPSEGSTLRNTSPKKRNYLANTSVLCCQLFSILRFGEDVSQKLWTRTVSVGFRSVTTDENRGIFQKKVDEAVDHLFPGKSACVSFRELRVHGTSTRRITPARAGSEPFQVALVFVHQE